MQYRPDQKAILQAIQDLLIKDLIPKIEDDELLAYKTLVSWNMLGVVIRELDKEDSFLNEEHASFLKIKTIPFENLKKIEDFQKLPMSEKIKELRSLNRSFAQKIRESQEVDLKSDIWMHIKSTLKSNLEISNPRFAT